VRVQIDTEVCQGHNMCTLAAPEIFKLREDDGHAYVESEDVPAGLEDAVRAAAETCPELAITVD
jgi:ferredoxin